ncbi:SDR family oxidoreductase [Fundidesulfovibrio butyratiphilus]
MRILITGNMGYIGPLCLREFRRTRPDAALVGLDAGFFAHCLTGAGFLPECQADVQYFADVRQAPDQAFAGVDAVVHLAAVSNDPIGKFFEAVTDAVNHKATLDIARRAKAAGAKHFVFASSCSMYGSASDAPRDETSTLAPLTAYARSKVASEKGLAELAGPDFTVTSLRFATACGFSPRLRLDLVLNDFVAGAVSSGKITILSDGTPWRPLIHVKDMARAIDWAVDRPQDRGGAFLAVNAGSNAWNHQVKDLAQAVTRLVPGATMSINPDAAPDKRSYQVNFDRFAALAPDHQPLVSLEHAVTELREGLEAMRFNTPDFRETAFMRLKVLTSHMEAGRLTPELTWTLQPRS